MLQAAQLNVEIEQAVDVGCKYRDGEIFTQQNQLCTAIIALTKAMNILFNSDPMSKETKVQSMKHLSDSCKLLCDLFTDMDQKRIQQISRYADSVIRTAIQKAERDERYLFGENIGELINNAREQNPGYPQESSYGVANRIKASRGRVSGFTRGQWGAQHGPATRASTRGARRT